MGMLSGEKISAARAVEVGLLSYAAAPEQMNTKVEELASKLVRGGPNAMAATKQLAYKVPSMPVDEAFKWTAEVSARCFASKEAKEGILAFNKRVDAPWVPKKS